MEIFCNKHFARMNLHPSSPTLTPENMLVYRTNLPQTRNDLRYRLKQE
jgi:hypothetical protein